MAWRGGEFLAQLMLLSLLKIGGGLKILLGFTCPENSWKI